MDILILAVFCLILLASIILDISLVIALLCGLLLFILYGIFKGNTIKSMIDMALSGVKTVMNILITFLVIGSLTALWRASGTIPTIICYSSKLIRPEIFILLTFIINAAVSTLTGTSFGTAATMGVICVSMAKTMGINLMWTGGALLAGAYYGDRCSPVSTSALLVSTITETNLYGNIKNMYKSAVIPTILSIFVFAIAGFIFSASDTKNINVYELFGKSFVISPIALIPAVAVLILSFCKMKVRPMLLISNALAFLIAVFLQKVSVVDLLKEIVFGFSTNDPMLAPLLNGGGIQSMLRVGCIVCIASGYSGIFEGTGLLNSIKSYILKISDRTCPFIAIFTAAVGASVIACNQTLAILLTNQLCKELEEKEKLALDIEDTAVIVAPLIPWSIAGTVALTVSGAPLKSLAVAAFLYIMPIYRCMKCMIDKNKLGLEKYR